ncbi:MAG: hypothetical protein WC521_04790 [Bdellovibrionales bacterium]
MRTKEEDFLGDNFDYARGAIACALRHAKIFGEGKESESIRLEDISFSRRPKFDSYKECYSLRERETRTEVDHSYKIPAEYSESKMSAFILKWIQDTFPEEWAQIENKRKDWIAFKKERMNNRSILEKFSDAEVSMDDMGFYPKLPKVRFDHPYNEASDRLRAIIIFYIPEELEVAICKKIKDIFPQPTIKAGQDPRL